MRHFQTAAVETEAALSTVVIITQVIAMNLHTQFRFTSVAFAIALFAIGRVMLLRSDGEVSRSPIAAAAPKFHAEFKTAPTAAQAGEPVELSFNVKNQRGANVRFLQFVHEKPMHLLAVSADLAEFYHLHPELALGDSYNVTHTFPHGGTYRLFADYTPPGSGQIVERFDLKVNGPRRSPVPLVEDQQLTRAVDGLRVTLSSDKPLRAGDDLLLKAALADAKTGHPVTDLQLYLGALAHFVIMSEDRTDFIHAHPLEEGEVFDPGAEKFTSHVHDPAELAKVLIGPSPSEVKAGASFPRAGLYKLWAQFQRQGHVIAVPFVLRVAEGYQTATKTPTVIPADAIKITVSSAGYEPSRIEVKKGQPVKLAFYRTDAENCAGTVVFPSLNIRQKLPAGETVIIEITPKETGELSFTCGMGMYKGTLVVN